jgi:hypothetical protein
MPLDPSNLARAIAACDTLATLVDTPDIRSRLARVRLLRSEEDIEAARRDLPRTLLPFMSETQRDSTDVYAFDLEDQRGRRVVVWNDHAFVVDWSDFDAFLDWLRRPPQS